MEQYIVQSEAPATVEEAAAPEEPPIVESEAPATVKEAAAPEEPSIVTIETPAAVEKEAAPKEPRVFENKTPREQPGENVMQMMMELGCGIWELFALLLCIIVKLCLFLLRRASS